MARKKTIIISILLLIVAGIVYTYKEFNRTNVNIAGESSAYTVNARALIKEFNENDSSANRKYVGKVISVKGLVKDINKDERGYYTISLGDTTSMSSIRCSIDSIYTKTAIAVKRGMNIHVKGSCTGFNKDELLGLDIIFNRCLVVNN
jgi:hypothetical protein